VGGGGLGERDNSEGTGLDGKRDNIRMDLQEVGWVGIDWTGWVGLRIGTGGRRL